MRPALSYDKTRQLYYKRRKPLNNFPHDHRHESPLKSTGKSNSGKWLDIFLFLKKDNLSGPSGVQPRNARLA